MKKIVSFKDLKCLSNYELWRSGWENKNEIDVFSYISYEIRPEDLLILGKLVFPDFILDRGAVILEMNYEEKKFNDWMGRLENDIQSVERFINHTHIYDIFSGCNEDVEDEIFEQLAHMLSLSWRLILKEKFP
ncbi:TPA: hypothetical protein NHO57_005003, partial [Pseudomonas aeruginosa]|nr:hypothetical protein [Pseudomonas aeruginosa]